MHTFANPVNVATTREEMVSLTTQNGVRKAVARVLSEKGSLRGRNPISQLCAQTDNNSQQGRSQVLQALNDLERDGQISLERKDGRVASIHHLSPRRHVDRTERSPQEKRERTFAKDVPAFLPDELCSPVVITQRKPTETKFVHKHGTPVHVTLTRCLTVLRKNADSEGASQSCARQTIVDGFEGIPLTSTSKLICYLRDLGLLVTDGTTYMVDLEKPEVTLDEARESRLRLWPDKPKVSESESESVVDDEVNTEAVLATIIETLEAQVATLNETIIALDEKLGATDAKLIKASERGDELVAENTSLRKQIDELEQQLSRRASLDPRVQAIIKRHEVSS